MLFDFFKKKDPELSCQAKKTLDWLDNKDLWKLKVNKLINEQDQLSITYYSEWREISINYQGKILDSFFSSKEYNLIYYAAKNLIKVIRRDLEDKEKQEAKVKFDELCNP